MRYVCGGKPFACFLLGTSVLAASGCTLRIRNPGALLAGAAFTTTATHLVFTTQPVTTAMANGGWLTQPAVSAEDGSNAVVTDYPAAITLAAYADSGCTTPASGSLSASSLSVTPSSGVSAFAALKYSLPGRIYLKATAPSLAPACSSAINLYGGNLAVGNQNGCKIQSDGSLKCWGAVGGTIGDFFPASTTFDVSTPVTISGASNVAQVSVGAFGVCYMTTSGSAYCWGDNTYGELGDATTVSRSTPAPVSGITNAIGVSAGFESACAVLSTGAIKCWGNGQYGKLGNGATTNQLSPVSVSGISTAVEVSVGWGHACAVLSNGAAQCWGYGVDGELGNGSTTNKSTPQAVSGVSTAISISAGNEDTCVVLSTGAVQCWGWGGYNLIGDSSTGGVSENTPHTVPTVTGAFQVALDQSTVHTCALLTNGQVQCWGEVCEGEAGNTTASSDVNCWDYDPAYTTGVSTAISIGTGQQFSCALLADNTNRCWGSDTEGELAQGRSMYYTDPQTVSGLSSVTKIAAGQEHTCALLSGGTVKCWGDNGNLDLGQSDGMARSAPTAVSGVSGASDIALGSQFSCVIIGGAIQCWGEDYANEFGDNGAAGNQTATPTAAASGITTASKIFSFEGHSCAILSDTTARCWGANSLGQLGNGTSTAQGFPVAVSGLSNVTSIATGGYHSCALLSGGTVQCWGDGGAGQLGNGGTVSSSTPVAASGISTANHISAGDYFNCVTLTSGTVSCWGDGNYGQMQGPSNLFVPTAISGITTASFLGAGARHICSVLSSTSPECWGDNSWGQLGYLPLGTPNINPAAMTNPAVNVIQLVGGDRHTCALISDGTVKCWGMNSDGQIGVGDTLYQMTPVSTL